MAANAEAGPGLTQRVARELAQLRLSTVPAATLSAAKRLLLDTLVVAQAGIASADVQALVALARDQGGRPDSAPWGMGAATQRFPAGEAALIDAVAASALDFDSLHVNVHPDAIALAAAWSMAQRERASGARLLQAFIAGSELICRLSDAIVGPQKGWTIGAVLGTFGASAAAAQVLGFDERQTVNSLGIALSMAAGSQQSNVERALTKRLQPGLAARAGVQAALLTQAGISAPQQALEGRFGLWALYFPAEASRLGEPWRAPWSMERTGLKLYPVCACSHAAMDALARIMMRIDVSAQDVARVEARISPFMDRLVGGEFTPRANPQVTAQFCLKYHLAVVLAKGRFGLRDLDEEVVLCAQAAALAAKVQPIVDARLDGELAPAIVKVVLQDGREFEQRIDAVPGSTSSPPSTAQVEAKYVSCLERAGARQPVAWLEALHAQVSSLEETEDMSRVSIPSLS